MIYQILPPGSTTNQTSPGVGLGGSYLSQALQFVVEAVGASPTVTYKFQGSMDNANWYDLGYVTDASDTVSQAPRVRTTVGADICFVANPVARQFNFYRVVVSAINNVTYRAEAHTLQ